MLPIIRYFIRKMGLQRLFGRASFTAREAQLVSELRQKARGISLNSKFDTNTEWGKNSRRLLELIQIGDPREILLWDVILETMFVENQPFLKKELYYLLHESNKRDRWENAIIEHTVGCPPPYFGYLKSSGNLIHHAYHLAQFEDKAGLDVSNLDVVFEFGGGYGSMRRLFANLNFKGKYIIFDLLIFSAIQKYYLNSINEHDDTIYVTDLADLKSALLGVLDKRQKSLFVATWSLSESPASVRDAIVQFLPSFDYVLFAYQKRFGEMENLNYFSDFPETYKTHQWHQWEIKHLPENYYLVGQRNDYDNHL
jgi:hypothetical protein